MTVTAVTCNTRYMRSRREELLRATLDYLLDHGISDISLRPLAKSIGTSARLLIFHFGSKEVLLAEAVAELQRRLQSSLSAIDSARVPGRDLSLLEKFWAWATRAPNLRLLRLGYEIQIMGLAGPGPVAKRMRQGSLDWIEMVLETFPPDKRSASSATIITAFFDGLALDLLTTGDRKRTSEALGEFVVLMRKSLGIATPAKISGSQAHGRRGSQKRGGKNDKK